MSPYNSQDVENWIVFGAVNEYRYRNWRDEVELRRFIPHALRYGNSPYHREDVIETSKI